MTEESNFAAQIENDRNKLSVRCQFCNCLMLKANEGSYCEQEVDVPLMQQKQDRSAEALQTEKLRHFWLIKDMMTFENIGFSHTVDGRKFLVCADCERGPVGYHELASKFCYLALGRVVHGDK
ncbi:guanine nucleotide exchange factor MSS4 homolog [Scaptodrosophila lebanonensis]|uniref:Guanine nucleotide exchange factor MSS4 homolog n=1 Tax=Drosophila lebanonensis TaxID=7225 RepID=A0A6J2U582_DROLE|nr:guanine nucleotide exchange factor MSS4 homolog [Scaptodrosophila lebanonensis]